jgi:hypothetical protein
VFTHAIEKRIVDSIVAEGGAHATRLQACSAKSGNHWLTTSPSCRAYFMSDLQMRFALRHRLGQPPAADVAGPHCRLCGDTQATTCHFHACEQLRGGAVTHRHNDVLHTLGAIVRAARSHFHPEPQLAQEGKKGKHGVRPDAIVSGPAIGRTMIDVSMVTSTCRSYVISHRTTDGIINGRVLHKESMYKELAKAESCTFVAFLLDSYGTLAVGTRNFLRELADSQACGPHDADVFFTDAVRAISFALQRGNADVSARGCELARLALPRRPRARK